MQKTWYSIKSGFKVGLIEKLRFEKKLKELRELNMWTSGDIPDKENNKCKGPMAGASVF